jgi:transposase InsO family protein
MTLGAMLERVELGSCGLLERGMNGVRRGKGARTTVVFHDGPYKALADVEYVAAGWVDLYNHRRLHRSPGWLTSVEYEQDHCAALRPRAAIRIVVAENP